MIDKVNALWKAKQPENLPDFIIGGAMKSGTTSLHAILNNHPDINIAHNELGFFDIDSILQHPDFNFFDKNDRLWTTQYTEGKEDIIWNWYHSQFEKINALGGKLGEDSTTYLASKTAAERIAMQDKPIKMIFILRHPTKRTVSNYLHLLKSGRAIYNLEDTLRFNPNSIIRRSLYKEQLETYYKFIPSNRIKVVLFEDLIKDKKSCVKEICEFIGVDFNKYGEEDLNAHANKTRIPRNINLQLKRNRFLRYFGDYRYSKFLPMQPKNQKTAPLIHKLVDTIHKRINPHRENYNFEPNPSTISFLDHFFKMEMKGIDELTQKEIYSKWF